MRKMLDLYREVRYTAFHNKDFIAFKEEAFRASSFFAQSAVRKNAAGGTAGAPASSVGTWGGMDSGL